MASPPAEPRQSPPTVEAAIQSPGNTTTAARRASRRGAPHRFRCQFDGCGRMYTRAEHLQRHQLNHNPREIFKCTEDGCGHSFVRADLLARHKTRHHSASYVPRHRVRSFSTPQQGQQGTSDPSPTATGGPNSVGSPTTATVRSVNSVAPVVSPTTSTSDQGHHQGHPQHQHQHQHPHQPHQPHQQTQTHLPQPPHRQHRQQPISTIKTGQTSPTAPHDAAILLTPESNAAQPSGPMAVDHAAPNPHAGSNRMAQQPGWSPTVGEMAVNHILHPKPMFFPREMHSLAEQNPVMPWGFPPDEAALNRDNFAMWLFDNQNTYGDFNVSNIPFLEGGLESSFNSNIPYDYESLTGRSQLETPPRMVESDEPLVEFRRQEVLRWFQAFRRKYPKQESLVQNIVMDSNGEMPALSLEMMRDCLREYWEHVSSRLPIIHQPTFSCNRCSTQLLLGMIALGAASLRGRDSSGTLADYGGFADVVVWGLRWEIVTAEEATPPVSLAVAQALLLLEFYEKMFSSRRLHERAHIYHSATLTLLRRGSPLIGRSGSESPPEQPTSEHPHGVGASGGASDSRMWWNRWAETEAMHRVVYAAFMMDVIHAAMFGHAADMAPHEIRLPLPCDDNLWTASTPEEMRQLDANLRMYGVKSISFLDGLKRAVHGKEVRTHSFGRMVIMSGLLSVGWHLSHRESHMRWLDLATPSNETRDGWRKTLLGAFDEWKESFDSAQGSFQETSANLNRPQADANGPIQSASVLYHLAQISLHVDIVDCQVFAGAKQLLGRKVSTRDHNNVVARMKTWASLPSTRHAVLHAFKLLHRVLVHQRRSERRRATVPSPEDVVLAPLKISTYSVRSEPDPHRPWIMYYATLSIWSFVYALRSRGIGTRLPSAATSSHNPQGVPAVQQPRHRHHGLIMSPHSPTGFDPVQNYNNVVSYLSNVAGPPVLTETIAAGLGAGLPDLLDCLHHILAQAHSELLKEACERLMICKSMLMSGS